MAVWNDRARESCDIPSRQSRLDDDHHTVERYPTHRSVRVSLPHFNIILINSLSDEGEYGIVCSAATSRVTLTLTWTMIDTRSDSAHGGMVRFLEQHCDNGSSSSWHKLKFGSTRGLSLS